MDLSTLSNLFSTTINPDPNIRKAAELEIRKLTLQEGVITALLQIIANDSTEISTRQACAVWLKNRVHTGYSYEPTARRPDQPIIAQSDRDQLRSNILSLIANSSSRPITIQLANILRNIIIHDFPERLPNLLTDLKALLQSQDVRQVHAGCIAALECVRAYRFRRENNFLPQIAQEILPHLSNIATQMMQTPPSAAQEIPTMLHLILKTYKTTLQSELSPHQQTSESIVPWGRLFFAVIQLKLPKEAVPEDEDERERCEWWKAKKWAYGTLGRLFMRYGNPSQLPSPMKKDYGAFAEHFVTQFAPEILNIYLGQVELFVTNQAWLSQKCQYQILQFFIECIKPKSTWTLLKPHVETLVSSFVFPHLSFTPTKKLLWESDPTDYVRVTVDETENFSTPVSSATSFLFSLASNRTKATFLPILRFINSVLESNAAPAQKYGALNMTAALGPWMIRHPEVKNRMEQFIIQFVTPELSNAEGYIRAMALEVLTAVIKSGLQWSKEENLKVHFDIVLARLDDPDFPVRVQAALALTEMVVVYDSVKSAVSPLVGKVIQDLLKLSDESELDILNHSMEVMVNSFQTELLPVAAQLTARLCDTYLRLAGEILAQEESGGGEVDAETLLSEADDDKTFAALGISKTINTIILSLDSATEILSQVQEVVVPILKYTFEHKLIELLDNMFDLVDSLTFRLRKISPSMWPIFETMYRLFKNDAIDFLDEMLPGLDNFVSFGNDVVKTRPDYKQMLLDIYVTAITNTHLGENDHVNGCKLAESILLNLRGSADELLQPIINTAWGQLDKGETFAFRLANLEVLINAVLYNPVATLQIIEGSSPGAARVFFDKWFSAINNSEKKLPRVHDKKLCILALSALLELSPDSIPPALHEGWPGIVGGILKIFKGFSKAVEARKELEDQVIEDEDEDDDDVDSERLMNLRDEEDDIWDEDSAYMELLAKEQERLRQERNAQERTVEDEDGGSDDDVEEELGYISAIDNVDPYETFKKALTTFQLLNPQSYQVATTALDIEQQTQLMEVMRIAEAVAAAAAQGQPQT
ncbi:ARM repeat-containing protein [Pluteus cervinus]|uniref:ARM repeat-containing protein n=1 Tax=Pluteus cervinus TaxID=181527 RepID=A0ACD3B043_9AGAR|nr:ARM repeat-containing protein [Pluteus cervinus]